MEKTTNYDMFKFRADNREEINTAHVRRIADSIKSRNLLHMRPIIVNSKMEVIDGQHRLLAAKMLGVDIYYKVEPSLGIEDMLAMNCSKTWGLQDYVNFFVQNGYQEYMKLREFAKKNNLDIRTAFALTTARTKSNHLDFKAGRYVFNSDVYASEVDIIWQTINYIIRLNGAKNSTYTKTTKFWNAMIKLVRSPLFNEVKFSDNLVKLIDKCSVRATGDGYCKMLQEIHNWKNQSRVNIVDEVCE